jgi:uncharacterized repeat protein (TIGR02543 family)
MNYKYQMEGVPPSGETNYSHGISGDGDFDDWSNLNYRTGVIGLSGVGMEPLSFDSKNGHPEEATFEFPFTYTITDNKVTITGYTGTATSIAIPSTIEGKPVTTIGNAAFEGKTFITSVRFPSTLQRIEPSAFQQTGLTSVTIPGNVKYVGGISFRSCPNLQLVVLEEGVETVEGYAFDFIRSGASIHLPSSLTEFAFGNYAYGRITFCSNTDSAYLRESCGSTFVVCNGITHGVSAQLTVTFDPLGGSVSPTSKTVAYGGTYGALPTATMTGFSFGGWYTSREAHLAAEEGYYSGTGTKITDTSTVSSTVNHTLYAKWTPVANAIELNKQGGSGGSDSASATYGQQLTVIVPPTRTGYTFDGYYDAVNGGTRYYMPSGASARMWNKHENTTLYAHWTENPTLSYTVIVNSGTGGGNFAVGATVTITANAAPSGKVFDKWTTSDGVSFANASATTTTFTMPAKNVSVTATYTDTGGGGTVTPGKKMIFTTKYEATFGNWLLFFLCFGFIWMWF